MKLIEHKTLTSEFLNSHYSKGLKYTVNADGKTCTVIGIDTCTDTDLLIPTEIDHYRVTGIGEAAFKGFELYGLGTHNVRMIPSAADELRRIVVPEGVTSIGKEAFYKCSRLERVELPSTLKVIGDSAFRDCVNLKKIILPKRLKSIADSMFFNCSALREAVIPNGIESIGQYSFYGCQHLKSVMVPESVTVIGDFAFSGCESLDLFSYGGTETQWETIKLYPYWKNNSSIREIQFVKTARSEQRPKLKRDFLFDTDSGMLDYEVNAEGFCIIRGIGTCTDTQLSIPQVINGHLVTEIGEYAFRECNNLISVEIPDGVVKIEKGAFYSCYNLEKVKLSESMTDIADEMFLGCRSLKNIAIPNAVQNIGRSVFHDCCSLISIDFPKSITRIGYGAFAGCNLLKAVLLPDSVIDIGERAFATCGNLTDITLSANMKEIPGELFSGCRSLKCVKIPLGVTRIGISAFAGCGCLEHVMMPEGLAEIDKFAFSACRKLKSVQYQGMTRRCAEWKMDKTWRFMSSVEKIVCLDGTILL